MVNDSNNSSAESKIEQIDHLDSKIEPGLIYDLDRSFTLLRTRKIDPTSIRKVRNALLKKFLKFEQAIESLPKHEQDRLGDLNPQVLEQMNRFDSSMDGATRVVFRTKSGFLIESVILRIETGRTTLCVSSQIGCAAACAFCATGAMGIAKNLTSAEILDQMRQCGMILREESRTIDNIVFMGMGEPFHNSSQLTTAMNTLLSPAGFNRSPKKITVSTVGIVEEMVRFAQNYPNVRQALSLHSAVQETRERLIPIATKYPIHRIEYALDKIVEITGYPPMIEYLMIHEVTDTKPEIEALVRFAISRKKVPQINLIPLNPTEMETESINDIPFGSSEPKLDQTKKLTPSQKEVLRERSEYLKSKGLQVTTRYSLGNDVQAACGQLIQASNRNHAQEINRQQT